MEGLLREESFPVPPTPPVGSERIPVVLPEPNPAAGVNVISDVPAFNWSFGCTATSAAMIAGYYDRTGYSNMYAGPTGGGVMPLDNSSWPDWVDSRGDTRHQCPLSATHQGLDGRTTKGHVDDYWIYYGQPGPDPWDGNWTEHTYGDCTGDYMKTNQWFSSMGFNTDGSTMYWSFKDGSPLDASEIEARLLDKYDGPYGFKLFYESRGYTVTTMYNQKIKGQGTDPNKGFTYAQFCAEIDAGRPVMIHVTGHTMVGIGYDTSNNLVYLHDTWDYSSHSMVWGGSYEGMQHKAVSIVQLEPIQSVMKDDLLGTWSNQGVFYRNSDTGGWVPMASPATKIAAGDIDNDGTDDLLGIWPAQGGVWVKESDSGDWVKLSTTADWICSGDMNGDGRDDLLGTWLGQGVYYRNSANGAWVQMATPATQIAAGDMDDDGTDDLVGIWPAQGGVWVKESDSGDWVKLSTTADWICCGDMNGDGWDDLLGTWSTQGVYYRNSDTGGWNMMATPATQIAAGDIDGDGTDDLLGIWPTQGGVWVKNSSDISWERLSSTADWIAAGRMRSGSGSSSDVSSHSLSSPRGGYDKGPDLLNFIDLSSQGPLGLDFFPRIQRNLIPQKMALEMNVIPGPGEPGFKCAKQNNLAPKENLKKKRR